MYLIVAVDCIAFDHTVFIILYSAIFAASMSINIQYNGTFSTKMLYHARGV